MNISPTMQQQTFCNPPCCRWSIIASTSRCLCVFIKGGNLCRNRENLKMKIVLPQKSMDHASNWFYIILCLQFSSSLHRCILIWMWKRMLHTSTSWKYVRRNIEGDFLTIKDAWRWHRMMWAVEYQPIFIVVSTGKSHHICREIYIWIFYYSAGMKMCITSQKHKLLFS